MFFSISPVVQRNTLNNKIRRQGQVLLFKDETLHNFNIFQIAYSNQHTALHPVHS